MSDLAVSQFISSTNNEICRICGEESPKGQILFHFNLPVQKLAVEICSYISIKLKYVRIYPNWICPGCQLQFESTKQFFDLIRSGQKKLAEKFGEIPRGGRWSKQKKEEEGKPEEVVEVNPPVLDLETPPDGRRRTTRPPKRLEDTMQGSELENLYSNIGLTKKLWRHKKKVAPKLIAHIESQDGAMLGDMLSIHRDPQRTCTRYECDICKEIFVTDVTFFKHVATHKNIQYECTECEKNFSSKALFDQHQKGEGHKGLGIIEMPFIEPEREGNQENIPKNDEEEAALDPGVRQPLTEPIKTRFVCSKCSKSFETRTSMVRHQITHSTARPYKCDVCAATFKRQRVLAIHKRSHTGERSYKCHRCPKAFTHRQSLKAHSRIHDNLRPYTCSVCKKSFKQLAALQDHKRIHTGERPYVCLICGNSFRTSSQCRLHQNIHKNQKNNQPKTLPRQQNVHFCTVCEKTFTQKSALNKHLRTHTGEKPYACYFCPRRFADPSNYKKHRKKHAAAKDSPRPDTYVALNESLTQISSTSDPDPDGAPSTNSVASESYTPGNNSLMEIFEDDNDRNARSWGLLRGSSDPVITEIHNDDSSQLAPQPSMANQMVCISYQDPMNPVSNKTTFYVVN